ncbi:MAG: hypothetical protein O4861_17740 [Trichodesmium sp. St16_bin4-tuft]|nr:hypothetical protein [Trichodesmium sp. St5_bin8]MDE5078446.1 hypothetical protein [Trichodesmium sp. St2_bin6]MDE5100072.1 hypothetical protein [Trichodesmium sp. St16_bin4-tuft]MDE5102561.1 hypothetical protein [Trichodesmium sp. St19_bin2]
MSNKEDKEKLQELTKEDKEKFIKEDKEKLQELIKQVKQATENIIYYSLDTKDLGYFYKTFGIDDGKWDDDEYELLDWLKDDLFKTEGEDKYKERIDNMKKKD